MYIMQLSVGHLDYSIMAPSRSFYFFIWFCTCLSIVVAGIIAAKPEKFERKRNIRAAPQNNSECRTLECFYTALKVARNMDFDVQPCDDFYKFACGGYRNPTNSTPYYNEDFIDPYTITDDIIMEELRMIIEDVTFQNETWSYKLARNFYNACMNDIATEERGLQSLFDNLEKLGGWPILKEESWNEDDFSWTDSVYKFRKLGYNIDYFINLDIIEHYYGKNVTHEIYLSPPNFGYSRNFLREGFNNPGVQEYYKYMMDIVEVLGADYYRATEQLKELLEFEIMLANISRNEEDFSSFTYDKISIKQLSTDYPSIPWLEYLNAILAPKIKLNQYDTVYINGAYLKDFEILINTTPKKVLANYALWRVVDESAYYITYIIRQKKFDLYGEKKHQWKDCVKLVSKHLDFSVKSMFYEYERQHVLKMVSEIRNGFKIIFEKADWLDEQTRANAIEKVINMQSYIKYPAEFVDIKKIDEHYEKLVLSADNFLGNQLNMTIFETNRFFDVLNKSGNKDDWWRTELILTTDNAKENIIQFSTDMITASVLFKHDRPNYINYGALGSVIGRHIAHDFDELSILYDKEDNFVDWMKSETKENFFNRTQCLVEQYGNYRDENVGLNLNGTATLDENIADNEGIRAAYYAYKELVKLNGQEQKLPRLLYTREQMFWISFASIRCNTDRKQEELANLIRYGTRSPSEFRTNGALSNIEEFSRDFGCQVGSKMNPVKKCVTW